MRSLSWTRIGGMLAQEFYITRRSLEVILDLYFYSIMAILAFGLLSVYLVKANTDPSAYYLLLGLVLWEVVRVNQYSMSVSSLWNVWSHNLSNLFVSPLSLTEYVLAQLISSFAKAITAVVVIGLMVTVIFKFNLPGIGAGNLVLFYINLSLFAWSMGLVILGLIFCFGTRIQSFAWGLVYALQPLCAVFFPVSVLPVPFRVIAYAFPPTYIFEAARANLEYPSTRWDLVGASAGLNAVYFCAALVVFGRLVRRSQASGQFAKNDL